MDDKASITSLEAAINVASGYIEDMEEGHYQSYVAIRDALDVGLKYVTCINDVQRLVEFDPMFHLFFDLGHTSVVVESITDEDGLIRVATENGDEKVEITCKPGRLHRFVKFI